MGLGVVAKDPLGWRRKYVFGDAPHRHPLVRYSGFGA
jgi:hypothetical protein